MIKFVYEIGLFVFFMSGFMMLGNHGYCLTDMIYRSFLAFMGSTIMLFLFLFAVAREDKKKDDATMPSTEAQQPAAMNGSTTAGNQPPVGGFSMLQ